METAEWDANAQARSEELAMASNKENRSGKPKTEGEKHQGAGVNTPAKHSLGDPAEAVSR